MGEVGLEHDLVHADLVHQPSRGDLLEPVAGIDVAREILGRQHVQVGSLFRHAVAQELIVQGFEREGNPADAALDRHELDVGIACQHAGDDQVAQLHAVAHEDIDGQFGERRHLAVGADLVLAQAAVHVARADVEADRLVQFARHFPQRVPVRVAQQRLSERLRLAGEQNALVAHGVAAPDLGDRGLDVPERRRGDRQQAARVRGRPLGLPVVIDFHAGQLQVLVVHTQEFLIAEAAHVRVHDHRPDAHRVHVGEALLGVERPGVHLVVGRRPLRHVSHPSGRGQAGVGDAPVAQEPPLAALGVPVDARDAVFHPIRHPAGPHVGGFGHVGIDVDDGVAAHTRSSLW